MLRWLIVIVLSLALGAGFSYFHVPAAWILGAILASGAMALGTKEELHVNRAFHRFGRGIIGVLAAVPIVGIPVSELLGYVLPGLVVALLTIAIGVIGGLLLARHGVSRETGILSMLAGGASVMPAIATDLGADVRYVALTQYLRLLAVSMTLPIVVSFLDTPGATTLHSGADIAWWMWLIVIAIALVGGPIGARLRLPAPSVFGPLLLTVVVSFFLPQGVVAPQVLGILGFLAIGWECGGSLSVPALRRFARLLPATIVFIVVVMGACALSGVGLMWWLEISYFEAYLATSPGALETVLALSAEGGAGAVVIAIQLIRMVSILVVAGYLPHLLKRFK